MTRLAHHHLVRTTALGVASLGLVLSPATLGGAAAAPAPGPSDRLPVTPDAAERRYAACMSGAPRTPDAHERWSQRCVERVASGRF